MAFRVICVALGIVAAGALVGALLSGMRPEAQEAVVPADEVAPDELKLYIDVYTAMQADHDLTIDQVLAQKQVTLQQFRSVERRVQQQERLVRKVREALTAQAVARADQLVPMAARTAGPPVITPTPTR